jgi:hypothetical protein
LNFIFQNSLPQPRPLTFGQPDTNSIPPCEFAYYTVDVPAWARFATNILISASQPVNVFFNQTTPPTGTNPGDFNLISNATTGFKTLSTVGLPPLLVPGRRYYLGVENPCANATNVAVVLQVDFDITPLTNAVPITNNSIAMSTLPRYFYFDTSSNATLASFQLLNLDGNANLAARKGVPLPSLGSFDYAGFNPGTNSEQILVFTNSTPVALSAGRWYLGVFNVDTNLVHYTILATEYTNASPNIVITSVSVGTNGFCLTWTSLPGLEYHVQGFVSTWDTTWTNVSPTITATNNLTTWCVPLPSPFSFFRVVAGVAIVP